MKEEDKVYRKVGRKYIPIGLHEPFDWLSDGIWLVHSDDNMKGRTNMSWLNREYSGFTKVGDIPNADFTKIAKIEQYVDTVAKVLLKYNHEVPIYDKCIADVTREIIDAMYKLNESKK